MCKCRGMTWGMWRGAGAYVAGAVEYRRLWMCGEVCADGTLKMRCLQCALQRAI